MPLCIMEVYVFLACEDIVSSVTCLRPVRNSIDNSLLLFVQVTIRLAKDMSPRRIVGVDIDGKLIRMAWKNLHR